MHRIVCCTFHPTTMKQVIVYICLFLHLNDLNAMIWHHRARLESASYEYCPGAHLITSPCRHCSVADSSCSERCVACTLRRRVERLIFAQTSSRYDGSCRCLSSKYFIWDPDLPFLSLGQVSVLKEIEWVQHASAGDSDLQWHGPTTAGHAQSTSTALQYSYLGLYIHSNQKMRYASQSD
jgi:hypothetical protein